MATRKGTQEPTLAGFQEIATRFKMLGDPTRLRILYLLAESPRSVGEIADALGCPQPTASRHLAKLQSGGILKRTQQGATVYYAIGDRSVLRICDTVCGALVRQAGAQNAKLVK